MDVFWVKILPIDENGVILQYQVLYQVLELYDTSSLELNTTELSMSLTELHEYANYIVQVRGYTDAGPGPYSNQQTARTDEAGLYFMWIAASCPLYVGHM